MKTRKFAIIIFFALIFSLRANAQHISLGPSIGAGISTVSDSSGSGVVHPQLLWNAGLTVVYSTKTHFGVGADLKYSSEGYFVKFPGSSDSSHTHVHLNYVRLPVRLIYFFGEYGDNVRPKIFLGFTPGLLVSAKSDNDVFGKADVKDSFNSFDLGVHAGAGLNFKLASAVWLNTDVALFQGLLNINNDADNTFLNRNIAVDIGIAFGIGGK